MRRIGIVMILALMTGGCRRESFDDQWRRKSDEASQSAEAMERDMQARLKVAQQAGYDLAPDAASAAASGP